MSRTDIRQQLLQLQVNGEYVITEFGGSPKFKALVEFIYRHGLEQKKAGLETGRYAFLKSIDPLSLIDERIDDIEIELEEEQS